MKTKRKQKVSTSLSFADKENQDLQENESKETKKNKGFRLQKIVEIKVSR